MDDEMKALLRSSFVTFVVKCFQTLNPNAKFKDNWHIDAIIYELERCIDGDEQRLIINAPPRTMKSLIVSVALPAWILGQDPSKRFICISYADDIAVELANQFRLIVSSDWYRELFPNLVIKRDTRRLFVTSAGGGRRTTSVGGSLTGHGADWIILDDPQKPVRWPRKSSEPRQ